MAAGERSAALYIRGVAEFIVFTAAPYFAQRSSMEILNHLRRSKAAINRPPQRQRAEPGQMAPGRPSRLVHGGPYRLPEQSDGPLV